MKLNKRIILLCSVLVLAAIIASTSTVRAQTSDTLTGYGLQLNYQISGADLGAPSDSTAGSTLQRIYNGVLSGTMLQVSGTFGSTGVITNANAYATVGSQQDSYTYSTGDTSFSVTVAIPNPVPPEGGSFGVTVTGTTGELSVSGFLSGGQSTVTTASVVTTASGVSCDPSDQSQYTQVGTQYTVAFTSLQTDKTSYAPGDTMVVLGAVDLEQMTAYADQNCPQPYPTTTGSLSPADPTQVVITVQGVSQQFPVAQNGSFSITLSIPSDATPGSLMLQVTANGPQNIDGTPTTATQTLNITIQSTSTVSSESTASSISTVSSVSTTSSASFVSSASSVSSVSTISSESVSPPQGMTAASSSTSSTIVVVGAAVVLIGLAIVGAAAIAPIGATEAPWLLNLGVRIATTPYLGGLVGAIYNGLYRTTTIGVPIGKAVIDDASKVLNSVPSPQVYSSSYGQPEGLTQTGWHRPGGTRSKD